MSLLGFAACCIVPFAVVCTLLSRFFSSVTTKRASVRIKYRRTQLKAAGALRALLGKRCEGTVIDSSNTFASLLLEKQCVAVVPGEAFGAPGFARLSYAVGEEKIREGVRRMAEFVASLT